VAVTTRWFVAAAAAGAATAWLPSLIRTTAAGRRTERIEAIATWTELLRDTLSAAAGLGQAITATADVAPRAIREPVAALAARLSSGVAMDDALRAFAAELDEPSGDLVVCALLLASTAQSQRLTELLGALAKACREEVAMSLRVEASRASARSSVRTVVLFSLGFGALLFVVAHSYLAPFGTVTGQLVLLVVCGCYAAGLWLMVRLVRPRPSHRLLQGSQSR
jgi:Flp pilus assembly protein TadB